MVQQRVSHGRLIASRWTVPLTNHKRLCTDQQKEDAVKINHNNFKEHIHCLGAHDTVGDQPSRESALFLEVKISRDLELTIGVYQKLSKDTPEVDKPRGQSRNTHGVQNNLQPPKITRTTSDKWLVSLHSEDLIFECPSIMQLPILEFLLLLGLQHVTFLKKSLS